MNKSFGTFTVIVLVVGLFALAVDGPDRAENDFEKERKIRCFPACSVIEYLCCVVW